jgi:hypothetical protein
VGAEKNAASIKGNVNKVAVVGEVPAAAWLRREHDGPRPQNYYRKYRVLVYPIAATT